MANTFDDSNHSGNNSFYWSPLQFAHLSTVNPMSLSTNDYFKGRLRHWLPDQNGAITTALAIQRDPTPDGSTEGQVIRYDYDGKNPNNLAAGTNNQPSMVAMILPDGNPRFTHYKRGTHAQVTEAKSTFTDPSGSVSLRTDTFIYAAGDVDLVQWTGANSERVVSNYFNGTHQVLLSYNALNEVTSYTYNGNHQLTLLVQLRELRLRQKSHIGSHIV